MNKEPKTVGTILRTKDYSMFNTHKFNRPIIDAHVDKLYKNMLVRGWEPGSVMTVNGKYDVIDGQHRLFAAMKAGIAVEYTVNPKVTLDSISKLNSTSKPWSIIDHIHHHVEKGNQNYILLDRFMKQFPRLRPTECMMLVKNNMSSADRQEFESGKFEVRNMELAYKWANNIMSLEPLFEQGYNKSIFVRAMMKIFTSKPEFSFKEFYHKVELRPAMLHLCGSIQQYLEMIEEIYNYRRPNSEKINLRF